MLRFSCCFQTTAYHLTESQLIVIKRNRFITTLQNKGKIAALGLVRLDCQGAREMNSSKKSNFSYYRIYAGSPNIVAQSPRYKYIFIYESATTNPFD